MMMMTLQHALFGWTPFFDWTAKGIIGVVREGSGWSHCLEFDLRFGVCRRVLSR